ncbi:MAG: hypothetical protein ACOYY2_09200 [Actinomycetota bacterium]
MPAARTPVALEVGRRRVFASALDWPGWCRAGRDDEQALAALAAAASRFATVAALAGHPLPAGTADRLADLLAAAWATLDRVAATAPAALRKGPRGGGRDRDAVVAHVEEAELAYARKVGVRLPARPGPALRAAVLDVVRDPGRVVPDQRGWPLRYAVRRFAWHVLDHAWEIEDRSVP